MVTFASAPLGAYDFDKVTHGWPDLARPRISFEKGVFVSIIRSYGQTCALMPPVIDDMVSSGRLVSHRHL